MSLLAMERNRFFGVQDCVVDEVNVKVTVSLKSQIYLSGAPFQIPEDVVEEYRHPHVVSIKDLNRSPVKRRAAVRGVVSQVGEVCTVRGGKRVRPQRTPRGREHNLHQFVGGAYWCTRSSFPTGGGDTCCCVRI